MDPFAFSGLLIGISSLLFGIFVYVKGRKSRVNQLWAIFCLSVAIWGFGGYKIGMTKDINDAHFWWQVTHIGIVFMPVLFYHFVSVFLDIKKKLFLSVLYVLACVFLFLTWSPWYELFFSLEHLRLLYSSFYWIRPPTPLYAFYILSWFGTIGYSHYLLYKAIKEFSGIRRSQIKYFFFATVVGFAGGGVCFIQVFGVNFYPILNFTVPLYPAIMAYAIVRFRLMDIRLVIKRSLIFTFLIVIITALFVFGAFMVTRYLDDPFIGDNLVLGSFFAAAVIAFGFQPLKSYLQNSTDKFLFVKDYNPQEFLGEMSDLLSSTLEPNKLYQIIVKKLESIFHCDKICLLLFDEVGRQYVAVGGGCSVGNIKNKIDASSHLIKHLIKNKSIIISEEVIREVEEVKSIDWPIYLREIKDSGADLIVPLFSKKLLIGALLLGVKKSGETYTREDLNVLEIVSSQASTAIVNAQLYGEMRSFNIKLKEEVARATLDLRKANVELKRLDQAKSEFISIASHQLRTPLTIIKGYISMMLEGSFGKLTGSERKSLDKVYISNERLI